MDIMFRTGKDVHPAHPSWYRGENCNFNPTKNALRDEGGMEEYIIEGCRRQPDATSPESEEYCAPY